MTWTATRLATRISKMFGLDEAGKTRVQRTFRNFVQQRYIPVTVDQDDERGTLLFGDDEAAVAVLLFPMTEMAVDARGLRKVAEWLLKPGNLDRAIAATRAGKVVTLRVQVILRSKNLNAEEAPNEIDWIISFDGLEADPAVTELMEAWKAESITLSTLTVSASLLLKPLLDRA